MKVWVVYNGQYADDGAHGVFLSDTLAHMAAIARAKEYGDDKVGVEVFAADVPGALEFYYVLPNGGFERS